MPPHPAQSPKLVFPIQIRHLAVSIQYGERLIRLRTRQSLMFFYGPPRSNVTTPKTRCTHSRTLARGHDSLLPGRNDSFLMNAKQIVRRTANAKRLGATVLIGKLKLVIFEEAVHEDNEFAHAGGE